MEEIIIKDPQTDEEVLGEYIESKNREVEMNNEEVSNLKKLSGKDLADKLLGATRYNEGISDLLNEENTGSNSFRASESFGKTNIEDLIKQEESFIKPEGNTKPKFPWEVPHMIKEDSKSNTDENTGIFSSIIRDAGIGGNTKEEKEEINSKKIDKEISMIDPNRDWAESTGTAMLFDKMDPKVARLVKGSINNSRIPIKGETYKNKSVTKKEIAFYATIALAIMTAGFTGKTKVNNNDHQEALVAKYNDVLDDKLENMSEKDKERYNTYYRDSPEEIVESIKESLNKLESDQYNTQPSRYYTRVDNEAGLTSKDVDAINDATDDEILDYYAMQDRIDEFNRGK